MAYISPNDFFKQGPVQVIGTENDLAQEMQKQEPNYFQKVGQAFKSGIGQVKQGFSEAANAKNPVQLFESAGKIGSGVVNTAYSPAAPVIDATIGRAINYAGDKISNNPSVQKFANSKAGEITSRVAEDVGNYANIAGAVGGVMEAPKVGTLAKENVGAGTAAVGRGLKSTGERTYGLTIAPEESTARALISYDAKQPTLAGRLKSMVSKEELPKNPMEKPITEANTAARKGLVGTEYQLGVQAKRIQSDLWNNLIQPKLQAVKGQLDMRSFFGQVEKEIKSSGGDLTRRNSLLEALNSVKQDYQNVSKINLEKLQNYKEGWAEFLPDATYKGKPIAASLKEVHNLMAKRAREIIYKHIDEEGKQAYIDYGNLKSIEKSGLKSITGDPATKSLSKNVWQFMMNKGVTPIATLGGKVLYKTGDYLEFIGKKGAKKVKDIVE